MDAERRAELMRLVELEYERTAKFIDGVLSTAVTVRGWAITVWLALLGVAFNNSVWELAALGAIAGVVFALVDGYHAWLYWEALRRVNELERLSAAYYDSLGRAAGDDEAEIDFRVRLESHRFGLYRSFKRFQLRDFRYARPPIVFRILYPFLIVVALIGAGWLGLRANDDSSSCQAIKGSSPQAIQCGKKIILDGKVITLTLPESLNPTEPTTSNP